MHFANMGAWALPLNTSIGQTKRALRDRFGEHRRAIHFLKENPHVELANHFI